MIKYFACSDIHSFYDEWMLALTNYGFDKTNPDHKVIICGDLFDRGSQSRECFEFVRTLHSQDRLIYVKGNHEELLFDCVHALNKRRNIGHHHISNGTVRTIANLANCSEYDILCYVYEESAFDEGVQPVLDFIEETAVDFFELGDKVFVHGWVPVAVDADNTSIVHDNWRDGDWHQARWECGFDGWKCGLLPPEGQTVVCGHWHTSYGWSQFRGYSEWGQDACFDTFIDNKIIALDACTAYTHNVNIVVFLEDGTLE